MSQDKDKKPHNVRDTSIAHYIEKVTSGRLRTQIPLYLKALQKFGTASHRMIAESLDMTPSNMTACKDTLEKRGIIYESHKEPCKAKLKAEGKSRNVWYLKIKGAE